MGNGQKAQMRRERNAKDAAGNAKSQLKVRLRQIDALSLSKLPFLNTLYFIDLSQNEAAKNIICVICRQTFLCTIRAKK
ncbi:hypothetical protein BGZ73_001339 [Actinomortierella ambigua]|nr:hypothetical protein BGZ73_001339 [Actinomortierella ambigua]